MRGTSAATQQPAFGLGPPSREEASRLIRAEGDELQALMEEASLLRDQGKGRTVTYSRKVFIPLTNLCRDKCGYCTFAKAPRHPDAKTMDPDEVLAVARAGQAQGCKEALFSLGEKPEERYALARAQLKRLGYGSTIAYLAAMCRLVFEETGLIPHANCGVMTRDELLELRDYNGSMGLMLESVSERLLEPGQVHFGCVGKAPATRLETMATAAELGIAFTTGMLIGIGETIEDRVDTLFAMRDLHERGGNIQEVIIQNFRVKPDIRMRHWPEPPLEDMLRTIAVARLVLGPEMNLQAPPNLADVSSGEKGVERRPSPQPSPRGRGGQSAPDAPRGRGDPIPAYQQYLFAGINDWGGVSPVTKDHINPERAWPMIRELRDVTRAAGFELRERLCLYPDYLARPDFVRPLLDSRMRALTDETGLVTQEATEW